MVGVVVVVVVVVVMMRLWLLLSRLAEAPAGVSGVGGATSTEIILLDPVMPWLYNVVGDDGMDCAMTLL